MKEINKKLRRLIQETTRNIKDAEIQATQLSKSFTLLNHYIAQTIAEVNLLEKTEEKFSKLSESFIEIQKYNTQEVKKSETDLITLMSKLSTLNEVLDIICNEEDHCVDKKQKITKKVKNMGTSAVSS